MRLGQAWAAARLQGASVALLILMEKIRRQHIAVQYSKTCSLKNGQKKTISEKKRNKKIIKKSFKKIVKKIKKKQKTILKKKHKIVVFGIFYVFFWSQSFSKVAKFSKFTGGTKLSRFFFV